MNLIVQVPTLCARMPNAPATFELNGALCVVLATVESDTLIKE